MKIIIATGNINKVKEIKAVLKDDIFEIISMKDIGIEADIEETGSTFEDNALIKARFVSKITGEISIADDSGLEVDYLDKKPGVFSARYGGADTQYSLKNKMILDKLKDVSFSDRTARFVCSMAAVLKNGEEIIVTRTMEGYIGYAEKGENGFGYDPIFYIPEYDKTLAEMDPELKNRISHRGKALTDLTELLQKKIKQE